MNRFRILSAAFLVIVALVLGIYVIGHPELADRINDFVGHSTLSSGISGGNQEASSVSKDDQIVKVIAIFLILGFIVFMAIMSAIDWMSNMRKLAKKNSEMLKNCLGRINALRKMQPDIKKLLDFLQEENPTKGWESLKTHFDRIVISDIWQNYDNARRLCIGGWFNAEKTAEALKALDASLTEYSGYCDDIKKKAHKVNLENARSIKLLESLRKLAAETKEIIGQKNVAAETVRAFVGTNKEFNAIVLEMKSAASGVNWAEIYSRLINIKLDFISAQNSAKHDIEKVDKAIKDGPIIMKNMARRILALERELFSLRAKDLLEEAKGIFSAAQAQANNGSKSKNWIKIYLQAIEAGDLLDRAQAVNSGTLSIDDSYGKAADMDNVTLIGVAGGKGWQPGAATI